MMGFGLGAAVLLLVALGFVLAGLRRPAVQAAGGHLQPYRERQAELERERELGNLDETSYQQLRAELQRRLLDEQSVNEQPAAAAPVSRSTPLWVWLLAGLLPVASLLLYTGSGDLGGWQIQQLLERSQQQARSGVDNSATLTELSHELRRHLYGRDARQSAAGLDPTALRAHYLLARVDMERGDMAAAALEYERLAEFDPNDAGLQAQAAQAAYLAADQRLTAASRTRMQRALELDPDQPTALGLAGIDAFEQGRFQDALDSWQRLLAQLPPGAPGADIIQRGIDHARQQLTGDAAADTGSGAAVRVAVSLGSDVEPQGTLFVFARVPGERMPLAAVRVDQPRFPLQVVLSDEHAMDPSRRLSSAQQVEIVARLSRSGQVGAAAGDAQARSEPVTLAGEHAGQVALELVISSGGA